MEQPGAWLSLDEAASVLKIGVPTVQSLINRGLLHAQVEAGQPMVSYDDLLTFLRTDQHKLFNEGRQPEDLGLISDEPSALE